jgi:hypothetical protein
MVEITSVLFPRLVVVRRSLVIGNFFVFKYAIVILARHDTTPQNPVAFMWAF